MSGIATAIAGSAIIGGIVSSNNASKAIKAANQASKDSQVDIDALDEKTRAMARQNAYDSAALENELTPEVSKLRTAANNAVLSGLSDTSSDQYTKLLQSRLGKDLDTPLLKAAIAKAQANLALGGTLDKDTQNSVTRNSLATTGAATGGLGLGRDVTARDLGLTSLQLENQRLNTALSAGNQEQSLATDNASNLLNNISMLQNISSQNKNYALNAAQYGQSIAQPVTGLDPSSVANIYAGNASNASAASANKANIYGAQSQGYLNLAGSLGSLALLKYGGGGTGSTGSTTSANNTGWFAGG